MTEVQARVRGIQIQLDKDIKDLEEFAKSKNLSLNYDRRSMHLAQRLNEEFLTYPKININGFFGDIGEKVQAMIDETPKRLQQDIAYTFKFKPNTDKLFQVKITNFHYLLDIRYYIETKYNIEFPYISDTTKEGDVVVKKFANGNAIIQLTEEQFNILKEVS